MRNPDFMPMQSPDNTLIEVVNSSAEMTIHAELNLPTVKINANLVLRELPRKLLLPIFHHLSPIHAA